MGNIATNLDQQIEKLQSRGMCLDIEITKVKELLLDIGYYRLGFYWCPFSNKDHIFIPDTKFSDIIALYYLDVDLRNVLMRYINRIEINFRTKLIYYVSNKYKSSPNWFVDAEVVSQNFIDDIDKFYNKDFIRNNSPIKKHHSKYPDENYAPAWKTLEFFSFGTILRIYKNLIEEDIKERISNIYGIRKVRKFISFIETIVLVRNTCAHSSVLFDFNTPKGISSIPEVSFERDNHSLSACVKVIAYILGKISKSRKEDMLKSIWEVLNRNADNQIVKSIIEEKMKFKL